MWPRVGSLVPGPIEPSTQRWRPSRAANSSAVSRAMRAPASDSSAMRSGMSYSASAAWFAPKVLVSTQSTPDVEVRGVHRADDVGAGGVEDLVAALELLEVLQGGVLGLEHRAHRAVGDHHTGGEGLAQGVGSGPTGGGGRGDGFGNEAMELLPGVRRLSALRLPMEGARRKGSPERRGRSGESTGRTGVAYAAECGLLRRRKERRTPLRHRTHTPRSHARRTDFFFGASDTTGTDVGGRGRRQQRNT